MEVPAHIPSWGVERVFHRLQSCTEASFRLELSLPVFRARRAWLEDGENVWSGTVVSEGHHMTEWYMIASFCTAFPLAAVSMFFNRDAASALELQRVPLDSGNSSLSAAVRIRTCSSTRQAGKWWAHSGVPDCRFSAEKLCQRFRDDLALSLPSLSTAGRAALPGTVGCSAACGTEFL
jgi:hypothetical protein